MEEVAARPVLLADADVLIDYADAERSILRLVSQHVGPLKVLGPVLREVPRLTATDCRNLRIEVVSPSAALLVQAAAQRRRLSLEDQLCFLTCQAEGWTCVTNDGALIKTCTEASVPYRRGLSLMIELVRLGHTVSEEALRVAQAIHTSNPRHINEGVLRDFQQALDDINQS